MAALQDDDCNLETLLAKATNPLHREPDPQYVLSFCKFVEKEKDGPQTALRLLAHKIQSPLEKESLMALTLLEETAKICGTKFKSEVGKFRFLNEMIKVVSPKYLGNKASPKVKQKIVELLYLWSVEMKQEAKIFEAYQMLRRQGVVMEDPVYVIKDFEPLPPPTPRPKNAVFDDEEKAKQLQRLLGSNKPEDLQAANKLIKNMVKEADRRMELLAKRSTEIETVNNNAKVLGDMLDHYSSSTSSEEKELMKELFESCERLRPKLFRLAGEMDETDEGLGDILRANDDLTIVINRYRKAMGIVDTSNSSTSLQESANDGGALLDLASPVQESSSLPSNSSLLDDQLLVLGLSDPLDMPGSSPNLFSNSTLSTNSLSDIDHVFTIDNSIKPSTLPSSSSNKDSASPSKVSSIEFDVKSTLPVSSDNSLLKPKSYTSISKVNSVPTNKSVNSASKGLEELDELGQSLLKQSLPAASTFHIDVPTNTSQKISLSQLKQQKELLRVEQNLSSNSIKNEFEEVSAKSNLVAESISPAERTPTSQSPVHEVLSLADIFVPLETIQPGSAAPMTLLEKNGLTVIMHFGINCPRADVSVMVISAMSKNSSPVKNLNFQTAVPKTMKIKLQPPSATDLPPHNPILPPAAITQVMLLANPQKEKVRFKYKITYTLNSQNFTEVGETEDLRNAR